MVTRIAILLLSAGIAYGAPWYSYTVDGDKIITPSIDDCRGVANVITSNVRPEVSAPAPLPAQFDNGIALKDEAGHWWKPVVLGGELEPIQISNSPLDPEQARAMEVARRAEIKAARSNRLTRIDRIAIDLQQVDGTISNIAANAATWPNQAQRDTIAAIKVAVRNLMQATEKVRKEIEP